MSTIRRSYTAALLIFYNNNPMTWLITGGAGYIGSHVVDQFLNAGKKVVVFDSLINGLKPRVDFINSKHPEN
jgi:UDP-glucose 4-epimerase